MPLTKKQLAAVRVTDVMTRDVVTVYANQEMSTAAQKLLDHRITGAPVVSYDEICIGVLSCKDFLGRQGTSDSSDGQVLSHMTSPAITVSEEHNLLAAASIICSKRMHRVPVVDNHGRVVGIVSTLDIVGQVLESMSSEQQEQLA